MQGYTAISKHLSGWPGTIGSFVRDLDRRHARYLAFSKVASLEFCPYRYYLECVQRIRLRPQPDYFVKGRLSHEVAARYYRAVARRRSPNLTDLHAFIDRQDREDGHHLRNALTLAVQNAHVGWEVAGVEEPFVLALGRGLPPCIGVVDLILRKGKHFAVVDHKTGKNFYADDGFQLVLYREYVRRRYGAATCLAMFDEYRWVNNLDRVRKPAFRRTELRLTAKNWKDALRRIANSYAEMQRVENDGDAAATGECFMCPYQPTCDKASVGYGGWY